MNKSNFNPKRIKFCLEYKDFGRVTDLELSKMFDVKTDTITRWKKRSPKIFDKIYQTGICFDKLMEMPNAPLLELLKMPKSNKYYWDKKRPNILISLQQFFEITGIKFEDIYENYN